MVWGLWSVFKSLYLRRRAIFSSQDPFEPNFTPLEYIKSDNSQTQYIILDYKPNHKTKIIIPPSDVFYHSFYTFFNFAKDANIFFTPTFSKSTVTSKSFPPSVICRTVPLPNLI